MTQPRRHRRPVAFTATLALVALLSMPGQVGAAGSSTVGAPGIGDPYFPTYGNGGYRVSHYDIDVRFDPATERLTGTTVITGRATKSLTQFNLDLVLKARAVSVNGAPAAFSQTRHELVISPASPLAAAAPMVVAVSYRGVPKDISVNGVRPWITSADGALALGQPEIAAWWFPSNDHPADKARFDIRLSVPTGLEAISNGRLIGRTAAPGWTSWHWRTGAPMATYLAFAAMGDYDLERGTTSTGIPYLYAFSPRLGGVDQAARRSIRFTGTATSFLERKWGTYPFGQIGGVVPDVAFGYALENQTRPIYSPQFFTGGVNKAVVIHEIAHQWFGDAVAVQRWRGIWLNEGFATYSEWLFRTSRGGSTPQQVFLDHYRRYDAGDPFWDLRIGDPGPHHIFDFAVYTRGAMAAHALRNRVGTVDFFTIMRRWVRQNDDGLGSTTELRALAEHISGKRLGGLFDAWLFSPTKPAKTTANGF